ncbi:Os12g0250540 [Oryza sativa Japonica Group]|uniref:Uncharacterized protein n=2 Tax=Oryza sativa subsp. japonica TaxID=39947 RepID=A0A8J8XS40_ORYSJ|nr:hypothetical protein OsJ_35725 [Oryza sativa Japonica Group]BAT16542.1 Os12g0250540 [Oryza sativa Japonica Group]
MQCSLFTTVPMDSDDTLCTGPLPLDAVVVPLLSTARRWRSVMEVIPMMWMTSPTPMHLRMVVVELVGADGGEVGLGAAGSNKRHKGQEGAQAGRRHAV